MQKLLIQALCAAAAFSVGFPAFAASNTRAQAVLETPVAQPATYTVENVTWSCNGAYCRSEPCKVGLDSVVKECRKTAAVIGPVKGYTTRGRDLTKGDLRACNTGATELAARAGAAPAAAQ